MRKDTGRGQIKDFACYPKINGKISKGSVILKAQSINVPVVSPTSMKGKDVLEEFASSSTAFSVHCMVNLRRKYNALLIF